MQHVAAHHRIDYARGKDVNEEIAKALRLRLHERRDVAAPNQRHASAGLRKVHNRQTDKERNRRDDLKIEQSLHAHASDFFQIAPAGDAHYQRRENERRND